MKSIKGNLEERIVFLKLKSGDADAFGYFYDKYVSRIYRYVYIKVSDRHTAEDLTQEIFLKIWQHMVDKKHIRSFQAYIFRIARNSVVDYYRSNVRQELPFVDETEETLADDSTSLTENKLDRQISLEMLYENLQKLSTDQREIILLRYVEDMSLDEIAMIMQKDKSNIRVISHRAIRKLKNLIQKK